MDILSSYFSYNKQYGPQIYFARMCLTKNLDFNRSEMVFETSTEIILDVCTIYSMAYSPIKSSIEDLMFICQPVRCVYSFQHLDWKANWIPYYEYDEWLGSFSIILKFCLGVTSNKGLSNVCFINQRCAPASGNNHVTTVIVWPMRFTNASFKGL